MDHAGGTRPRHRGRVELGLGAGWYEQEHTAYGIPFPALGERFDRLGEALAIVSGLWSTPVGERFSFTGEHFNVVDSPALPKPVQPGGVPIMIGGTGPTRTPALAARYAAEFNTPFRDIDTFVDMRRRVIAACETIDRDPAAISFSVALVVAAGRDEAEFVRRAAAIGRQPDELRANGAAGTPDEVAATLERWHAAGAERLYLQVLDLDDVDHLDTIASAVSGS